MGTARKEKTLGEGILELRGIPEHIPYLMHPLRLSVQINHGVEMDLVVLAFFLKHGNAFRSSTNFRAHPLDDFRESLARKRGGFRVDRIPGVGPGNAQNS